jgi:spermidine synthase
MSEPWLPEVSLSEERGVRYLHLGSPWVQGAMRKQRPLDLELEYVRRMMGWLLFVDADAVAGKRAVQLGLGAAALSKFCALRLGMRTTAVEINPQVVAACRQWFKLPDNDAQFNVVLADAAQWVNDCPELGGVDLLHIDLYDHDAAGPVLDDAGFYGACRRLLSPEGALVINLFGRHASFAHSMNELSAVFDPTCLWAFDPTQEGNTVVMAFAQAPSLSAALATERAGVIRERWGLKNGDWVRRLRTWTPQD